MENKKEKEEFTVKGFDVSMNDYVEISKLPLSQIEAERFKSSIEKLPENFLHKDYIITKKTNGH